MNRRHVALLTLSILFLTLRPAWSDEKKATLDDLKKLDIICFVPSYLPAGFKLKSAEISYDEAGPDEDSSKRFPLYGIEWTNRTSSFSIESAREGIGDRNLMETDDSEDAEFQSPLFGRVYVIYTPKGKGDDGVKKEIRSNWVTDANMNAEHGREANAHPVLGRFHGFTGTNMTVAEFTKIVNSLHPIRGDAKRDSVPPLKLHPKIFDMIDCWLSDSVSPVVTEFNLDAVEMNKNEFNYDDVKPDGEWTRCPVPNTNGFMRYRVLSLKGSRYTVEFQNNGGGTLTTDSKIEFAIDKRNIQVDGKTVPIRILRVFSYRSK
jgi:hypothetical protein